MTGVDTSLEEGSAFPAIVVAPYRRDAPLLKDMLVKHGVPALVCARVVELARSLNDGTVAILTQEALTPRIIDVLAGYLAVQPEWSELPLILLLDGGRQNAPVLDDLRARLPKSKLTILQRPVRVLELVTAVQTAIKARRRQVQLRDHLAWQDELRRELDHRVKNALANVFAIYHMTLRQSASLEEFGVNFEGRLAALSRVHSALASSERRAVADIADIVLAPYRSASTDRIKIEGPPLFLDRSAAVTLALCLHELATNAAKYGALSTASGAVRLAWDFEPGRPRPQAYLRWSETGGPPVERPARKGYGTAFVTSAIKGSMAGTVEFHFRRDGVLCEMAIPMEAFVVPTEVSEATSAEDGGSFGN
jgi:two-component sensor histidine kinase